MLQRTSMIGGAMAALLALSACSRGEPDLITDKSNSRSPDEFSIVPSKPLTMPEDVAALPAPTPGGSNRTDPTPEADAIVALGGKAEALVPAKISSSNAGLVNYAARFGTDPTIRTTLQSEDLQFRSSNRGRPLQRWFNLTVYYDAYSDMSLDKYAELAKWRKLGVQTEGAPPPGAQVK